MAQHLISWFRTASICAELHIHRSMGLLKTQALNSKSKSTTQHQCSGGVLQFGWTIPHVCGSSKEVRALIQTPNSRALARTAQKRAIYRSRHIRDKKLMPAMSCRPSVRVPDQPVSAIQRLFGEAKAVRANVSVAAEARGSRMFVPTARK